MEDVRTAVEGKNRSEIEFFMDRLGDAIVGIQSAVELLENGVTPILENAPDCKADMAPLEDAHCELGDNLRAYVMHLVDIGVKLGELLERSRL